MDKITYPKQTAVKKTSFKKTKEVSQNTAIFEIKQQIDELETSALNQNQKTDVLQEDQTTFEQNSNTRLTAAENQITANKNNITNLQSTKQNVLSFDNTPTIGSANPVTSGGVYSALSEKQNVLTAGSNITINQQNVISATDTTYTAGTGIAIDQNNKISTTVDASGLQTQITNLGTSKQDKLTAGAGISINAQNVISATGGGAGTIDESPTQNSQNAVSSGGVYTALANKQDRLTMDLNPAPDSLHPVSSGGVYNALSNKQDVLTAGTGITIDQNNVISTTGGSGGISSVTAGDVDSESATTGQVLTADGNGGASWQTPASGGGGGDVSTITAQVNQNTTDINYLKQYVCGPDPYYTGKTPTDYPADTILQTYDTTEINFEKSVTTAVLTSPKVYFCCEAQSTGTIKFYNKIYFTGTVASVMVKYYLNDVEIRSQQVDVLNLNEEVDVNQTFYDLNFNTEDKGNVFYATFQVISSSASKQLHLCNQKIEIFAPNADIINKICPFNVVHLDGYYHLSDCTTGYVKTAVIPAQSMYNMDNLQWTTTSTPALNYLPCFGVIGNGVYVVGNQITLTLKNDLVYTVACPSLNISKAANANIIYMDWRPTINTNAYFASANPSSRTYTYSYNTGNNTLGAYAAPNTGATVIKYIASRFSFNQLSLSSLPIPTITIDNNGTAKLFNSTNDTNSLTLGYYTDATICITSATSSSEYALDCYLKKFDKIIKKSFIYKSSGGFTLQSEVEMGSYDKFYLMTNNDYFVVKNDQLMYYRLAYQQAEE